MDKQQNELMKTYFRSRKQNVGIDSSEWIYYEKEGMEKVLNPQQQINMDAFTSDEKKAQMYNKYVVKDNKYIKLGLFGTMSGDAPRNDGDLIAVATLADGSSEIVGKDLKPSLKGLTFKLFGNSSIQGQLLMLSNLLRMKYYGDYMDEYENSYYDSDNDPNGDKHNIKHFDYVNRESEQYVNVMTKDNKKFIFDEDFKIIRKNG